MDICFRAHSSGTADGDKKFPCLESNVKLKVVSILFHFIQVVSSHVGLIGLSKRFFFNIKQYFSLLNKCRHQISEVMDNFLKIN